MTQQDYDYTEPPLPGGFTFVGEDAELAAAGEILAEANASTDDSEVPLIAEPRPGDVILPGGVVRDGHLSKDAEVRELTGEDEEFIARALNSTNRGRFAAALLERGVVNVGGKPVEKGELDALLIGDRDMLIHAIRKITYGNTLDVQMLCRKCAVESQVRVDLTDDVPVKELPWSAEEQSQPVHDLPSGKRATMRLANGLDQKAIFDLQAAKPLVTNSEMNSMLLSRTLLDYDDIPLLPKTALSLVRQGMGGGDRQALVKWLVNNQPGPDYDEVKHTCEVCGEEQPLGLTASDLFPSF